MSPHGNSTVVLPLYAKLSKKIVIDYLKSHSFKNCAKKKYEACVGFDSVIWGLGRSAFPQCWFSLIHDSKDLSRAEQSNVGSVGQARPAKTCQFPGQGLPSAHTAWSPIGLMKPLSISLSRVTGWEVTLPSSQPLGAVPSTSIVPLSPQMKRCVPPRRPDLRAGGMTHHNVRCLGTARSRVCTRHGHKGHSIEPPEHFPAL